jgi:phage-related tail fiber protein
MPEVRLRPPAGQPLSRAAGPPETAWGDFFQALADQAYAGETTANEAHVAAEAALDLVQRVGDYQQSVHAIAKDKWLRADGAAVSRTTYATLFSLIGTNFGAGDGSTTFNLPTVPSTLQAHTYIKALA